MASDQLNYPSGMIHGQDCIPPKKPYSGRFRRSRRYVRLELPSLRQLRILLDIFVKNLVEIPFMNRGHNSISYNLDVIDLHI